MSKKKDKSDLSTNKNMSNEDLMKMALLNIVTIFFVLFPVPLFLIPSIYLSIEAVGVVKNKDNPNKFRFYSAFSILLMIVTVGIFFMEFKP